MTRTGEYHGTTVTDFVARYYGLLLALVLCLGLMLLAGCCAATSPGLFVGLFGFCAAFVLWLALLFQCARARPLTALMELFAVVLLAGFVAVSAAWLAFWWAWRALTLPVCLYMILFLLLDGSCVSRRPALARRGYQLGLRLCCLLLAALFAYLLARP
jgi:hypothetical protein